MGEYDVLIIPGGLKGAGTMSNSARVQALIREFIAAGKYVAMICAGASFHWITISGYVLTEM